MTDALPSRIGKYPIIRELGKGSTSRVYLARDPFAEREVAIKVFSAKLRGGETQEAKRFRKVYANEASLVRKLHHPHIAAIYDAAAEGDVKYIVVEYVPGVTLAEHCDPDSLLPIEKAIEIIFKCTRALNYALQNGVIHRDIKPANILISRDTDIKITDFGLAMHEERFNTTQLTGVGSPAYMSPEQIKEQTLNHRTDIYSLGVVMYQMLTGKLPFNANNNAGLTYLILHQESEAPRSVRPEIPEVLEKIILKAMQKKPAERYQTWLEFAKELTGAAGSLKVAEDELSDTKKFNTIKRLSFFRDFADAEIWEVLRISNFRRVYKDAMIVREGERGDCFFFVAQGGVEVTRAGTLLNILNSGDCFGEMLYFAETTALRTTTITAAADSLLVEVKASALKAASEGCQIEFNKAFIRILIERLSSAHERIAESS
ncbi:MAG TPA: serine/threonine-protein kinase [Burkholderiales bacterium]|nr:serine/threonine-protein kinase [Burkholderiales bacterium]